MATQKSFAGLLRGTRATRGVARRHAFVCALATLGFGSIAPAIAATNTEPARISIVIDDLGNSLASGRRVIALPAPVVLAILPHTSHGARLAADAKHAGKEVLLHLPMQPLAAAEPGPGVVEVGMPARELGITLDYDLRTVPHAIGVSNHMGSRMTQDEGAMRALLGALRSRGNLFFLDSRTGAHSAVARVGQALGVPILARDVFLDHHTDSASIRARLDELVAVARRRGHAIGIGHPHARTLSVLEKWLATAAGKNIRVAPLSELLQPAKEASHGERARTARTGM